MVTDGSPSADRQGRTAGGIVRRASRLGWLRVALLHRVIARPGFWFATACGWTWGAVLGRFRLRRAGRLVVASGLPKWAYGRGGTTIGAVYLTTDNAGPSVLEHEAVHAAQWKKYGLAFIPLYLDAGQDARHNRFEIEAGLAKGGYGR